MILKENWMTNNKYILGINGWYQRSHDSAACIIKNGEILAMAEEERFLRKKHAYDKVPINAVAWCLNKIGITLDDIDTVAIGWDYDRLHQINGLNDSYLNKLEDLYFPKKYFKYTKTPNFVMVDHHLAHAACSYYLSGFDEASILIIDGQGEDMSGTMAVGKNGLIKIITKFPVKDSLGYFYEAASEFVGLGLDAPGKLMGLASYGQPIYQFDQFDFSADGYSIKIKPDFSLKNNLDQQQSVVKAWLLEFEKTFGKQNNSNLIFRDLYGDFAKNVDLYQFHKDFAASIQSQLEKTLLHLIKVLISKTGINNVCLGGGVALNCSTNTLIAKSNFVKKYFVPPMTHDAGTSLGAALYVSSIKPKKQLKHSYLGPEFSNDEIKKVLDKVNYNYQKFDNICCKTADLLSEGKIISWFQGAMEVGPRALGNRSILGNPILSNINKDVNLAKDRELWRPLAPSILEEYIDDYLEDAFVSPFMLHTFKVKNEKQKIIPAVTHVDGSTRPQTVDQKRNPKYHQMIHSFYQKTGIPLVLNTSFNGAKEPIVCTPLDAITSFFSNATDYLVIGDFLVKK